MWQLRQMRVRTIATLLGATITCISCTFADDLSLDDIRAAWINREAAAMSVSLKWSSRSTRTPLHGTLMALPKGKKSTQSSLQPGPEMQVQLSLQESRLHWLQKIIQPPSQQPSAETREYIYDEIDSWFIVRKGATATTSVVNRGGRFWMWKTIDIRLPLLLYRPLNQKLFGLDWSQATLEPLRSEEGYVLLKTALHNYAAETFEMELDPQRGFIPISVRQYGAGRLNAELECKYAPILDATSLPLPVHWTWRVFFSSDENPSPRLLEETRVENIRVEFAPLNVNANIFVAKLSEGTVVQERNTDDIFIMGTNQKLLPYRRVVRPTVGGWAERWAWLLMALALLVVVAFVCVRRRSHR